LARPVSAPETTRARHPFLAPELLSDDAICALLDDHEGPVEVNRMSAPPDHTHDEWAFVDTADHPGRDVLAAVQRGRLWVNIIGVDRGAGPWRSVADAMVEGLSHEVGGEVSDVSLNVLVSSPRAQVYFHADTSQTVLFHLRGRKRIWVYPPFDDVLVDRAVLEDVYLGQIEELPYRPEFDARAEVFDLEPGDAVAWPAIAPHRVENLHGLNVSASFNFGTDQTRQYELIMRTNRYLRQRLRVRNPALTRSPMRWKTTHTLVAAARRIRPDIPPARLAEAPREWVLDPQAPDGARYVRAPLTPPGPPE
jgi:hypothetical protein